MTAAERIIARNASHGLYPMPPTPAHAPQLTLADFTARTWTVIATSHRRSDGYTRWSYRLNHREVSVMMLMRARDKLITTQRRLGEDKYELLARLPTHRTRET